MSGHPVFIEVAAAVRYWEDAKINGVQSAENGEGTPLKTGFFWKPVIKIETGEIKDWPQGVTMDVHYKVCDAGEYWLQDSGGNRIAKWEGDYVPSAFLCHGDNGYGDYIILKIDAAGQIESYTRPVVDDREWKEIDS